MAWSRKERQTWPRIQSQPETHWQRLRKVMEQYFKNTTYMHLGGMCKKCPLILHVVFTHFLAYIYIYIYCCQYQWIESSAAPSPNVNELNQLQARIAFFGTSSPFPWNPLSWPNFLLSVLDYGGFHDNKEAIGDLWPRSLTTWTWVVACCESTPSCYSLCWHSTFLWHWNTMSNS